MTRRSRARVALECCCPQCAVLEACRGGMQNGDGGGTGDGSHNDGVSGGTDGSGHADTSSSRDVRTNGDGTLGDGSGSGDAGHSCLGITCASSHANCGPVSDGCGGLLDCGTCGTGQTCGGGGMPSQCGTPSSMCTPRTCATGQCGPVADGCGSLIQCGSCATGQTCGGGGTSLCGTPTTPDGGMTACQPRTCASVGANCGPVGDGCGALLQCGTCPTGQSCGGGGTPSVCGTMMTTGSCTNLCLQQVACTGGATTTLSGTVYAPNGLDPLYNALVYIPNAPVQPFAPGVSCDQCGATASGSPLGTTVTGPDGTFTLSNAPVGTTIPLVIQLGRWRRQVVVPTISACTSNTVAASLTHLPQNQSQGDIPLMAMVTGNVDSLECVLRKIGLSDSEFTVPTASGGNGRVQIYVGNGANVTGRCAANDDPDRVTEHAFELRHAAIRLLGDAGGPTRCRPAEHHQLHKRRRPRASRRTTATCGSSTTAPSRRPPRGTFGQNNPASPLTASSSIRRSPAGWRSHNGSAGRERFDDLFLAKCR